MAVSTQREIATQMIGQLRLLDPSISAALGTPERKIIDTVAQSLADAQIDLVGLQGAFDLDSKFGATLDRFLGVFGYGRQKATAATGFVEFSRATAATADIRIPANTNVLAPVALTQNSDALTDVTFYTTQAVTLVTGATSVSAPIRANLSGSIGNVAAGRITRQSGSPILGITTVTNTVPTTGGNDQETDEELKIRFRNTIFRNLAGTQDQFLALAVSTAVTTKANVIGPQTTYREYIQIPPVDDATSYDVNDDMVNEAGGGDAGEFTTALSSIPYAKTIYTSLPVFVSNGEQGADLVFYREGVDYQFNVPALNVGDTKRFDDANIGEPASSGIWPNLTFLNVYTGDEEEVIAPRPEDLVLIEYKYLSEASRNDLDQNITNAVDMYIDGGNETLATTVINRPSTVSAFVDSPTSKYHYENYRRIGEPFKRPRIGNILTPLFWQPIADLPEQILVGDYTYYRDTHYWPVADVSEIGGTVRARSGIEWSMDVRGQGGEDEDEGPYTGFYITEHPAATGITIEDYLYDRNIVDLQAIMEKNKQITTDVLVHKAHRRFFKLDISVMYQAGVSSNDVNTNIQAAVDRYLKDQYFGNIIQLSDLLGIIHQSSGVDNVRWSTDIPNNEDLARMYETDENGVPLQGVSIDRYQTGTASQPEIQALYITGEPEDGSFILSWDDEVTAAIAHDATAGAIQTALTSAPVSAPVTVTEDTRSAVESDPIRSFRITFTANGVRDLITADSAGVLGGPTIFSRDFFLRDNELASLAIQKYTPPSGTADTVPGLIIRPRAQNTWIRGR